MAFQLRCDGACDRRGGPGAGAAILCDNNGKKLDSYVFFVGAGATPELVNIMVL